MIKPNSDKTHLSYGINEFYRMERKADPTFSIDYRTYRRVILRILYLIGLEIIRNNYVFTMPFALGKIGIIKVSPKSKNRAVDFSEYKKTGKVKKYLNRHSNWCYFRFKWSKGNGFGPNVHMYSFKPARDEKRREIGKKGLVDWIYKLHEDPYSKNYDALSRIP